MSGRYRHAYERTWRAMEALCETRPIREKVATAYLDCLLPLTGSDLPEVCKKILAELNCYFSNDSRNDEHKALNIISIARNNTGIMSNPLAVHFRNQIKIFAFTIFFSREED